MSAMPDYIYSPNAAARAQAAVACASRKLTKCEHRMHVTRTGSDRREAIRAYRSAQRQLDAALAQLARVEDKRPNAVTV